MLTPDMQLVLADFVMVVASFLRFEILLLRRMKTQRFVLVAYPVFDPVFCAHNLLWAGHSLD